ncbi:hypothetical protein CONPUDRAFT_59083 [Coniophora puteana RWD-64-598 SS2]|uniref:Uncharacterized protein n=1 Tax=Coniophora puteana (strain RWD-64-598) TaxID=741705 RepID=A0A5M3MJ88_CONPW|nr:uncharacterized protein CONPUDRAFT_59083 [Coniophora puteana RWD-64-598 SS2]EIW79308.1 hypothetical protein CONPUDRAFT_59083 [Coniophora puteana RWD-64-598 SS2]
MSLDQNLFTLALTPNSSDPSITDLVDPSGVVHYSKVRVPGAAYRIEVYDPISQSLLATATAPSATSKHKTVELYNPTQIVELKHTGTLSFRWSFKWEDHEFEWKREECYMIRKPDPPVLVTVTKEPRGRIQTSSVQMLDYNLNRFQVDDRKGLEIVILTALLTFQDSSDAYHRSPSASESVTPSTSSTATPASKPSPSSSPAPKRPPKPAPKTGVERISELQAGSGEVNVITVGSEGKVSDYATYCSSLLQDDAMLFVTVRSSDSDHVPKVLQVVEETKRARHKAGIDKELHQYVVYDSALPTQKGTRVIKLDDEPKDKSKFSGYTPPSSVAIHLSKIDIPELQPRSKYDSRPSMPSGSTVPPPNETKKERKEREKREKEQEKKLKKGKGRYLSF